MEKEEEGERNKKQVIKIPSYQEVVESSVAKSTPPNLFVPSQSQTFSEAFSFLKSSEFYSPPPTTAASSSFSRYTHTCTSLLLNIL